MRRIHLILLSWLLVIIDLTYILHYPKFSYAEFGTNVLNTIPLLHWILLTASSALLVLSMFRGRGRIIIISGLLYGMLFYITNLHFIVPYEQTDIWPSATIEFILSSGKIYSGTSYPLSYLSYPIFFTLVKNIILITGIGKISIYSTGLFVFLGAFYVGLMFYYYDGDPRTAVLSLATYIILSFYVINDQLAPQTLALVFLPYLYRLTLDIMKNTTLSKLVIMVILWLALVFTHPFMFLFYMLPLIGAILYERVVIKRTSLGGTVIGAVLLIGGAGLTYVFFNNLLRAPLRRFINSLGKVKGETWWVIANFFKKMGSLGPVKYVPHPHYELISRPVVELQVWILRILLLAFLGIILYSFLSRIRRSISSRGIRPHPFQTVFEASIVVSSGFLFILGLVTTFLGQRVFQVAFIPLSRYLPDFKKSRALRYAFIIILIIVPVAYTFNTLTNLTVGPQLFVEDGHLIISGYFGNTHIPSYSRVIVARELYPSQYPREIRKASFPRGPLTQKYFDYLYYSPKFKHAAEYYGVDGHYSLKSLTENVIYSNGIVEVIRPAPSENEVNSK